MTHSFSPSGLSEPSGYDSAGRSCRPWFILSAFSRLPDDLSSICCTLQARAQHVFLSVPIQLLSPGQRCSILPARLSIAECIHCLPSCHACSCIPQIAHATDTLTGGQVALLTLAHDMCWACRYQQHCSQKTSGYGFRDFWTTKRTRTLKPPSRCADLLSDHILKLQAMYMLRRRQYVDCFLAGVSNPSRHACCAVMQTIALAH